MSFKKGSIFLLGLTVAVVSCGKMQLKKTEEEDETLKSKSKNKIGAPEFSVSPIEAPNTTFLISDLVFDKSSTEMMISMDENFNSANWEPISESSEFVLTAGYSNCKDWDFYVKARTKNKLESEVRYRTTKLKCWESIAKDENQTSTRYSHTAVWTGTQMIVWGGQMDEGGNTFYKSGGVYSKSESSWKATSEWNAPMGRSGHTAIWTGSRMIVWGGTPGGGIGHNDGFDDGASYDPTSDTWSAIATDANTPTSRFGHVAVWTGEKMIVFGGMNSSTYLNSGGIYDPNLDSWQSITTLGAPSERAWSGAVWNGEEMIVFGGQRFNLPGTTGPLKDTYAYNPDANSWRQLSTIPNEIFRAVTQNSVEMHNGKVFAWPTYSEGVFFHNALVYDISNDEWSKSTYEIPVNFLGNTAIWTGTSTLFWGGMKKYGGEDAYHETGFEFFQF
jgi:N-acetylneuraminic acid mutarotase